jgi:hypothetical protein
MSFPPFHKADAQPGPSFGGAPPIRFSFNGPSPPTHFSFNGDSPVHFSFNGTPSIHFSFNGATSRDSSVSGGSPIHFAFHGTPSVDFSFGSSPCPTPSVRASPPPDSSPKASRPPDSAFNPSGGPDLSRGAAAVPGSSSKPSDTAASSIRADPPQPTPGRDTPWSTRSSISPKACFGVGDPTSPAAALPESAGPRGPLLPAFAPANIFGGVRKVGGPPSQMNASASPRKDSPFQSVPPAEQTDIGTAKPAVATGVGAAGSSPFIQRTQTNLTGFGCKHGLPKTPAAHPGPGGGTFGAVPAKDAQSPDFIEVPPRLDKAKEGEDEGDSDEEEDA